MNIQSLTTSQYNQNSQMKNVNSLDRKEFAFSFDRSEKTEGTKETVDKMLADIEEIKDKIDFELTVENVMKYKEVITSFLKYYSENVLQLRDIESRHPKYGYREKMTIVSKVEEGVKELDDVMSMLDTRSGHLEALKRIGEINGLIMDLTL